METQDQRKIEAIYELREAVEQKVYAKLTVDREDTSKNRDQLLNATLDVEAKTQDAIEVCHECGRAHSTEDSPERRSRAQNQSDNVIKIDFGQRE